MRLYTAHVPPWQVFTTRLCLLAVTIQYVQSEILFAPAPRKKFHGNWTVKNKGRRGWKLEDQVKMRYKICKHKQEGNQYELITPIINKYATKLVSVEFKYMFMETPKNGSALTVWLSKQSGSNFTLDEDSKKLKAGPLNKFHKYELAVPDGKYCNLQVKFSIQGTPCVRICCLTVKAAPILSYMMPENGALRCKLPIQNKCIKKSDYVYNWVRSDKRYQNTKSYAEVAETTKDFSIQCSVGLKDVPNSVVWSPDFFVRKTCPAATNGTKCCTVSKIKNDRCFIRNVGNETAKPSLDLDMPDEDPDEIQHASHGTMNNWNLRCVILPVSLVLWW